MKVTLVRHGQTVENSSGIVQGHLPGKLSIEGLSQARQAGKYLVGNDFTHLYSSDLDRTMQTTREILKSIPDLPKLTSRSIREFDFGDFQGMHRDEIDWDSVEGDFKNKTMPGGENHIMFRKRIADFINSMIESHPDAHLLIVTHGGVIRHILSSQEDTPLEEDFTKRFKDIPNASIHIIEDIKPMRYL